MIGVALIGCGYWGKNYLRILKEFEGIDLLAVFNRSSPIDATLLGDVRLIRDLDFILADKRIDAVVISTPLETHYEFTKRSLLAGNDVLLEKAFTNRSCDAWELGEIARKQRRVIMAGHLFEYHPAVVELKKFISDGLIGRITKISSERSGISNSGENVSVLWSLGPHDIYIANTLVGRMPCEIDASNPANGWDVMKLRLDYGGGISTNVCLDRTKKDRVRKIFVECERGSAFFDDTINGDKLVVYDADFKKVYSGGNFKGIPVLEREFAHFIDCVKNHVPPLTGAKDGYENVVALECAEKSMTNKSPVKIIL